MKPLRYTILAILLSMPHLNAANFPYDSFASYAKAIKDSSSFMLQPLSGFVSTNHDYPLWGANTLPILKPYPYYRAGGSLGPTYISEDGNCLVAYGLSYALLDGMQYGTSPRMRIQRELESNMADSTAELPVVNIADYLDVSVATGMINGATAYDSIYTYIFPHGDVVWFAEEYLDSVRLQHFPHVIGLIVSKGGNKKHLPFKVFLSENGMKEKDAFIRRILESIHIEE